MKNWQLLIFLLSALTFSTCVREPLDEADELYEYIRVLDDASTGPTQVQAGVGGFLCTYRAVKGSGIVQRFNFVDNEGFTVWSLDLLLDEYITIFSEDDGSFSIFSGFKRIHLGSDGNVISEQPNFLKSINVGNVGAVIRNSNGNFVIAGTIADLNPYAMLAEVDNEGKRIFRTVSPSGTKHTGLTQLDNGEYRVLSARNNPKDGMFFLSYDENGKLTATVTLKEAAPNNTGFGLDTYGLLRSNNNFLCFTNKGLYNLNSDGALLDSVAIFGNAVLNSNGVLDILSGASGFFREGLYEQNSLRRYSVQLDLIHERTIELAYPGSFSSICRLSNGNFAVGGRIRSFGDVYRPVIIISR